MIGSAWSLLPAVVAIVLALITKEVYSSLFVGIIIGGIFYTAGTGGGFGTFLSHVFTEDGLVGQISDAYNVGILFFLVLLGIMVALMNKAGGSKAFGDWAKKHIKSKVGAQVATICLGILIFIDDYFNCLTVGSVMRPVTEKYKVSKEKLAYLIDSTAAPICIIAPISSWAAAVSGFVTEGENGIALFCKAIPFNFYAIFTVIMMFAMVFMRFEFGKMSDYEKAVEIMEEKAEQNENQKKGIVLDLVFPVAVLIVLSVLGLIYSGGFFDKESECYKNFIEAFANSDASVGLVFGAFGALLVSIIYYICRRVLNLKECMECVPDGFKAMVPAILILTLAWTLKNTTDSLGAKEFVAGVVGGSAAGLKMFLPAIIFVISCLLAFATGTSWGTFGILIPICIAAFPDSSDPIRIISISACMAGAVCGDHCSPISDTTIMASVGAQCKHLNHVSSQLPYAISCAVISFLTYIVAGVTHGINVVLSAVISMVFGILCLLCFLFFMKQKVEKKNKEN